MQDYGRGVIVGEPTFGMGAVATMLDLSRFIPGAEKNTQGRLKLTIAMQFRVTGHSVQRCGATPDITLRDVNSTPPLLDIDNDNDNALAADQIAPRDGVVTRDLTPLIRELRRRSAGRPRSEDVLDEAVRIVADAPPLQAS